MAGLVEAEPTTVQRSVYHVPVPPGSSDVAFFEANSWQTSSLYVQFTTTDRRLSAFLAQLGTSSEQLKDGETAISIPARLAKRVDWTFASGHRWAGLALAGPGQGPQHDITVNRDSPKRPTVYVVSTISFAHHTGG
jgi:hypothetical protein